MVKKKASILDILKGKFLVEEGASKNWYFVLFLASLAIIMIYNIHQVEQKVAKGVKLNKEIAKLKSEYTNLNKQLMQLRTESKIMKMAQKDSLEVSKVPPYKLALKRK